MLAGERKKRERRSDQTQLALDLGVTGVTGDERLSEEAIVPADDERSHLDRADSSPALETRLSGCKVASSTGGLPVSQDPIRFHQLKGEEKGESREERN